jgi:hypothetical protein
MVTSSQPAITTTVTSFPGTHITINSTLPFDTVLSNLHRNVGIPEPGTFPATGTPLPSPTNAASFTASIQSVIGPHDFFLVHHFDYGVWLSLFDVHPGRRLVRILLGNPLLALTLLRHDPIAALSMPLELMIVELEDLEESGSGTLAEKPVRGTRIVYQLPSSMFRVLKAETELLNLARVLDGRLEAVVTKIMCGDLEL